MTGPLRGSERLVSLFEAQPVRDISPALKGFVEVLRNLTAPLF